MKEIVKFVLAGSVIVSVLSNASQDFSGYEGMHWHDGIVAEVQSHYPGRKVEAVQVPDDTGSIAAIILVLQS
jgi:hypothetical protein